MSVAGIIFGVFVLYNIVLSLTRVGEVKVIISVIPKDAQISINNKPAKPGTIYLSQGDYLFEAKKQGWKDDKLEVQIDKTSKSVGLIPEPDSDEARSLLNDDPELQLKRESLGGERAAQRGDQTRQETPIIGFLPTVEITGPFRIDYGPSQKRAGGSTILVSSIAPKGRWAALEWIREHGQDPTDLEIKFEDFINPLLESDNEN